MSFTLVLIFSNKLLATHRLYLFGLVSWIKSKVAQFFLKSGDLGSVCIFKMQHRLI